jgi:hypothetical protein
MKKIGFLVLALVVALGGLGIGYAAWIDTVYINGTVTTGSLDLEVVEYSGMWFWKLPNEDPEYYFTTDPNYTPTDPDAFVVASAHSQMGSDDDHIVMTFDNLFPLGDGFPMYYPDQRMVYQFAWRANFVIHYVGTVPAIVDAEFTNAWGDAPTLWNYNFAWVVFERLDPAYEGLPNQDPWDYRTYQYVDGPIQLEGCEYFLCWMCIEIPQDPTNPVWGPAIPIPGWDQEDWMNLCGGFEAEITAIQWNEYTP